MTPDLELDRSIADQLRLTWSAFFGRFGRLTEIQRRTIPPLLAGRDVLASAPTASGKTEAVCAPLIERNMREHLRWMMIYVSPTRALANDLLYRLSRPCEEISIRIAIRTGDHPSDVSRQPQVLITTPESLDSLLCRGRDAELGHVLAVATTVVLDEIHLLHGSGRGEHLRWLLARLRRLRAYAESLGWIPTSSFQTAALSATVPDPQRVATRFLDQNALIVSVPGQRDIETVTADADVPAIEQALPAHLAANPLDRKILVFSNTRRRVDDLSHHLSESLQPLGYEVHPHHGSLSKSVRETTEEAARICDRVVVVATSTLEIGIDIGAIDLVVLDGPAPDVPSLLQRVGRGNRRTSRTRIMTCSGSWGEVIIHAAMLAAARRGDLGQDDSGPWFAVARQQVASYIFQSPHLSRPIAAVQSFLDGIADHVVGSGLLEQMVSTGDLVRNDDEVRLNTSWIESFSRGSAHSIIESPSGTNVFDAGTGQQLMEGIRWAGGRGMKMGPRLLEVTSWENRRIDVRAARDPNIADTKWGYISGQWYKGSGQPNAMRSYLSIPTEEWPVIRSDEGYLIFHFGGARRAAVLRLLAPEGVRVDEWLIASQSQIKPDWATSVAPGYLLFRTTQELDMLERKLGRPFANRHLHEDARLAEVREWLRLDAEAEAILRSVWSTSVDQDVASVLRSIAGMRRHKTRR
jgi:ATP-dependent Lhr-like helicase